MTNGDTLFGIPHNFHPHLVQFRVLARNGQPPAPGEAGVKDTISVGPGETVRLQATFGPYLGRYVYHCHMIDHSASGMMAQMKIVPYPEKVSSCPRQRQTVQIGRHPEAVFAFLARGENDARWRPNVLDVARVSGEGVGARYKQGLKGPGGAASRPTTR